MGKVVGEGGVALCLGPEDSLNDVCVGEDAHDLRTGRVTHAPISGTPVPLTNTLQRLGFAEEVGQGES